MNSLIWHLAPLPPSANQYWKFWRNRVVVSSQARQYKKDIARLFQTGFKPIAGPCRAHINVYRMRAIGDLDNFLKVALDAFKGIFWVDDSQIIEIVAKRYDRKLSPGIEIAVEEAICASEPSKPPHQKQLRSKTQPPEK